MFIIWSEFNAAAYSEVVKKPNLGMLFTLSSFMLSLKWRTDGSSSKWFLGIASNIAVFKISEDFSWYIFLWGYSLLVATWQKKRFILLVSMIKLCFPLSLWRYEFVISIIKFATSSPKKRSSERDVGWLDPVDYTEVGVYFKFIFDNVFFIPLLRVFCSILLWWPFK